MNIFFSEYLTNYSTYTFGYTAYCQADSSDEIPEIYSKGFLPYTGNIQLEKSTFYMARSLRIDLERFSDTSENRRINRKASELNIEMDFTPLAEFDLNDEHFVNFCTNYAAERFAGGEMTQERFQYVLSRNLITHIIEFKTAEQKYGYVLACMHSNMLHYWFSFFDIDYMQSHSLGKWMMWKTISWAKENTLSYVYLGTCYLPKSLYKVRDHKGIAFFDGTGWNEDAAVLKYLCQQDAEPREIDIFKSEDEKTKSIHLT